MNLKFGWNRRSFLSALGLAGSTLGAPGGLSAAGFLGKKAKPSLAGVDGHPIVPITSGLGSTGDIYAELGVTPLVNINGTVTVIGGSVMKPEVMELIRRGNEHFVLIDELEIAAGKFIAKLCKSPAGYTGLVTGGAAAAMVVGYAGMMTEDLEPRMRDIPDVSKFPRYEVIIQKSHRYAFDHQIRQTGAKLIEVETREEMIAAINPKTVAIHFTNILSDRGKVSGAETVAIAKAHNLYTFNDASADVPPKERLWEYPAMGFDMVTFSGGKDICGPQASGVLIGREDLIHYSLLNMSRPEGRKRFLLLLGEGPEDRPEDGGFEFFHAGGHVHRNESVWVTQERCLLEDGEIAERRNPALHTRPELIWGPRQQTKERIALALRKLRLVEKIYVNAVGRRVGQKHRRRS